MKKKLLWVSLSILFLTGTSDYCLGQAEDNKDLDDDNVEQTTKISAMLDGSVKDLESGRFTLPFFLGKPSIDSFTNGQSLISVGLTADIGSKNKIPMHISDAGNPKIKLR